MNSITNKNILIPGGTGFIGSNLADFLCKKNQVYTLSRSGSPRKHKNITHLKTDINNPELASIISKTKPDFVFNAAAALSYRHATDQEYQHTNIKGTQNLFHALKLTQKKRKIQKVVHLSSVGVYGPIKKIPAGESHPKKPQTIYEKTKLTAEKIALSFATHLPINIIQPTLVYGPGDTSSGMYRFFLAVSKKKFLPIGKKTGFMHPLYIDNLTDALVLAATTNKKEKTWIIGDNRYYRLEKLASIIAKTQKIQLLPGYLPLFVAKTIGQLGDLLIKLGISFPLNSGTVEFATTHRAYSIKKAKTELKYSPKINFHAGASCTINYYREKGIIR